MSTVGKLTYLSGDALEPKAQVYVIAHVVNNKDAMGSGFVVPLMNKYPIVKTLYHQFTRVGGLYLGNVQFIPIEKEVWVANMVAQDGFPTKYKPVALNYDALSQCLQTVGRFCQRHKMTMVGPKFGAGISGGSWDKIEQIIENRVCSLGVNVEIYSLPAKAGQLRSFAVCCKVGSLAKIGDMHMVRILKIVMVVR